MTQEEMGRALDAANRKLAAKAIEAAAVSALDRDYAQIMGEKRAAEVRFNERGEIDEASVAAVVKDLLANAPPKFRTVADTAHAGPQFYDSLRAAVAKRHEVQSAGGTAELSKRMGQ